LHSIPILCYHKVGPAAEVGRRLNIEPARLRSHIQHFKRRGFSFVKASELHFDGRNSVCLTFDDAYASALTYGMDVLDSESAVASFYAVPSLVGGKSEWDGDLGSPLAEWSLLRAAQSGGHEVGTHTNTHCDMSALDFEAQAQQWAAAHAVFAENGIQPKSACLPYGKWNASSNGAILHSGYKRGLALGKRIATERDDLLLLPRVVVAYSDSVIKLLYKMYVRPHLP
jgi:peptidoglycan/xylan/chitin deacetylase (PgdA/CDA1 family)